MRHGLFRGATIVCVSSYFQPQTLMSHLHVFLTGSRGHCNTSSLRSAAVALSTSQWHVSQVKSVCLSVCLQWFTGFCVIMGAWTCCTAHILQNILLLCFKTLGMMFFLFSLLWYSYFHAILHLIHCVFTSRLCKPCFLHVLPCIIQVHSNTAATLGP